MDVCETAREAAGVVERSGIVLREEFSSLNRGWNAGSGSSAGHPA